MNRITLAIAFSAALGGGTIGYVANNDGHLTFVEPASSADVLSPEAAALYVPMDHTHITEVAIIPRGIRSVEDPTAYAPMTHATYDVPSTEPGLPPVHGDHWSATRSETVPGIVSLAEQVIFPAALAKCPGLASPRYPALSLAQLEYVGVEAKGGELYATGSIVSRGAIAGMPSITCRVSVRPPAEALAVVAKMSSDYLVPAIKAERGLR